MQCVEQGLLSLDEPVGRILPDWVSPEVLMGYDQHRKPILKPATQTLTLRHLLTHSAGMAYAGLSPRMTEYLKAICRNEMPPKRSIRSEFGDLPLLYEPGEGWEYSCAIDWAGQMVERVNGGISLGQYMQKNIWEPLGMKLTTFRPSLNPAVREGLVESVCRSPDGKLIPSTFEDWFPGGDKVEDDYGGAGLFSCAEDYIKLLSSLLMNDGNLLMHKTVEELFRPQLPDTKYIQSVMEIPEAAQFLAPSFGTSVEWNYALGGAVAVVGVEGRADKGMVYWAGLPNSYWVS